MKKEGSFNTTFTSLKQCYSVLLKSNYHHESDFFALIKGCDTKSKIKMKCSTYRYFGVLQEKGWWQVLWWLVHRSGNSHNGP